LRILPAVDMLNGKVVQLVGGVPGTEKIVLPDPVEMALKWESMGAPGLHVIDLDGALGKGNNIESIKDIIENVTIPVQVGGGIRSDQLVDDLLEVGARTIVVGTKAIKDPIWLARNADEHPGRIVLALDVKGGMIQVRGWQEDSSISMDEMFRRIEDLPLAGVLHTNVDVEGKAEGIAAQDAADFIRRCPCPVIASGGISSMEDLAALEEMGAEAVVIGIALYTGKLNPEQLWGERP